MQFSRFGILGKMGGVNSSGLANIYDAFGAAAVSLGNKTVFPSVSGEMPVIVENNQVVSPDGVDDYGLSGPYSASNVTVNTMRLKFNGIIGSMATKCLCAMHNTTERGSLILLTNVNTLRFSAAPGIYIDAANACKTGDYVEFECYVDFVNQTYFVKNLGIDLRATLSGGTLAPYVINAANTLCRLFSWTNIYYFSDTKMSFFEAEINGDVKFRIYGNHGNGLTLYNTANLSNNITMYNASESALWANSHSFAKAYAYMLGVTVYKHNTDDKYINVCGDNSLTITNYPKVKYYPSGSGILKSFNKEKYTIPFNDKINAILAAGQYSYAELNALAESGKLKLTKPDAYSISRLKVLASSKISYSETIILFPIVGQSLSVQGGISADTTFYNSKMFQNNVLLDYTNYTDANAVATYFGNAFTALTKTGTSGPVKYMQKTFMQLLEQENGIDPNNYSVSTLGILPGAAGLGEKDLLDPNMLYYNRCVQAVYYANKIAKSAGKNLRVPVVCWHQGENSADNVDADYGIKVYTRLKMLCSDIKAITGQTDDVKIITYQTCSRLVDIGQTSKPPYQLLDLCLTKSDTFFGMAMYHMEYDLYPTDWMHTSSRSYQLQGAMYGVQAKRMIIDNNPLKPIYPNLITKSGNNLIIDFDVPVEPLVFRKSPFWVNGTNKPNLGLQTNYGFSILNGSSVEIITGVTITGNKQVTISCSENPTGLTLHYAKNGNAGGGNLADSQGNTITTTIEGTSYRVDNFAPVFKILI